MAEKYSPFPTNYFSLVLVFRAANNEVFKSQSNYLNPSVKYTWPNIKKRLPLSWQCCYFKAILQILSLKDNITVFEGYHIKARCN
jgi:hypothetical protein